MQKIVISLLLASLLASCASYKAKDTAASGKSAPIVEGSASSSPADLSGADTSSSSTSGLTSGKSSSSNTARAADSGSGASSAAGSADSLNAADSLLSRRSVFYPLDAYGVQDADKPVVQAHAQYLSERAGQHVRLEGNCDERGSTEYNLALGQRRAEGVKKILVLGGARDSQVEAVSYGEERPKAAGHDEAAWAQNRRTDLNYGG